MRQYAARHHVGVLLPQVGAILDEQHEHRHAAGGRRHIERGHLCGFRLHELHLLAQLEEQLVVVAARRDDGGELRLALHVLRVEVLEHVVRLAERLVLLLRLHEAPRQSTAALQRRTPTCKR